MKKKQKKVDPTGVADLVLNPGLAGPGMADIKKTDNLEHWEDLLVDWLFIRHKIRGNVREALRRQQEEKVNSQVLTLEAWNDAFPTYPVFLVGGMVRGINKMPHGELFCKFKIAQLLKKYEAAEAEIGDVGKPIGFVVRWPMLQRAGESSGGMVLHSKTPDFTIPGSRLVWSYNEPEHGMLVLQPLSLLIKELDSEAGGFWRPEY